ncbi:CLUMA_CG019370, isoform A [Clunio marinus]|uniref:CLUMA_CG019370, isoform A n=1 Tax=Clunio marinus TaxID=568069 RepID=A0A1J1J0F4_9DIPT|nr:CLUMA_CG019370, isoform A [Clunio marinus]
MKNDFQMLSIKKSWRYFSTAHAKEFNELGDLKTIDLREESNEEILLFERNLTSLMSCFWIILVATGNLMNY